MTISMAGRLVKTRACLGAGEGIVTPCDGLDLPFPGTAACRIEWMVPPFPGMLFTALVDANGTLHEQPAMHRDDVNRLWL